MDPTVNAVRLYRRESECDVLAQDVRREANDVLRAEVLPGLAIPLAKRNLSDLVSGSCYFLSLNRAPRSTFTRPWLPS